MSYLKSTSVTSHTKNEDIDLIKISKFGIELGKKNKFKNIFISIKKENNWFHNYGFQIITFKKIYSNFYV